MRGCHHVVKRHTVQAATHPLTQATARWTPRKQADGRWRPGDLHHTSADWVYGTDAHACPQLHDPGGWLVGDPLGG